MANTSVYFVSGPDQHPSLYEKGVWTTYVFTSPQKAEDSVSDLPQTIALIEVDIADICPAILSLMLQNKLDVVYVDDIAVPVTEEGAVEVDAFLDTPFWVNYHKIEGDPKTLWDHLLQEITRLCGAPLLLKEESARKIIAKDVQFTISPEPGQLEINPYSYFWVSTKGLTNFGHPEVEMRKVPVMFVSHASKILINLCAKTLTSNMESEFLIEDSAVIPMTFRLAPSPDPYWRVSYPCLRLEVAQVHWAGSNIYH